MPYYFYVLQSLKDGFLYKGSPENIEARIAQHNAGKTKSLRHRTPFKLVHIEEFSTREEAIAQEKWSKTLQGGKVLREILRRKS